MKGYTITRKFRGAEYVIEVSNPEGVRKGIRKLTVNGIEVEGNIVPIQAPGSRVMVKAVM